MENDLSCFTKIRKNSQNYDDTTNENGQEIAPTTITTAPTTNDNLLLKFNNHVSECDILFIIISILQRIIAVGLNIYVAYDYYNGKKFNYFIWTICFIIFPLIITTLIYYNMFLLDQKTKSKYKKFNKFEIIIYIIIFPMIFRYAKSLYLSIKCKNAEKLKDIIKQRHYYKLMIQEENDISLIRLFECFMDAAPQKILQIFIIIKQEENHHNIYWSQYASIIGCFFSLSWSMVTYNKYNRYRQSDKDLLSFQGCILQILWYFFTTISRILCISMLICLYPIITIIIYFFHSMVFSIILIFYDKLQFCINKILSIGFCLIFGIVYIFVYIMPKDNCDTKLRYIIYYIICIIENGISLFIFIYLTPDNIKEYFLFIPICILSNLLYFIGITFMIIYYLYYHPKAKRRNCINIT